MREEHKLNKAIKQDGYDTQSEILDDLKRRYPQYVEQSDNRHAPVRKRRVAVISAFAAVCACAAIIVPCAVLLPNSDNNGNGGNSTNRYCTLKEYSRVGVEYTIGDYRKDNNRNFLYFDWYELCEDCETFCYKSNSDGEVLCLQEQVYLPQSDDFVQFSLTKSNVYLQAFEFAINKCNSEKSVYNHTVKWSVDEEDATCIVEDNGYRYFIRIKEGQNEDRLFDLVAELLEKN